MLETCENLNNQAVDLAQKGQFQEAIACFKRALIMEKENYLLWYNLGLTYRDTGDIKNAISAIKKAYEINTSDVEIIETLAILYYTIGNLDEAMLFCSEGLRHNPQNEHLWNTIGVINFNRAQYKDAEESFEMAVTINPYYYDALFNLRDSYEQLGNKSGYDECVKRMKTLNK